MQEQDNKPATTPDAGTTAANSAAGKATQNDFVRKIVDKIKTSENILIALSRDPSVDEIAAAIGLALYLDGMGKHATAIYSGRTPDELSFLQPNETFEKNTDSLQDFIISLNKEKADHLRYKLEGDFVKVFITPYKTRLAEEDLEFSYGDYNVDFVIAVNVPASANLDAALREHGRIMHDASVVNITTGEAGKFGEIEWTNPVASSLCEMVTELVFALQGDDEVSLDHDVATALLTGIVAATERFSNNRTNSDTLSLASKLMSMGADQQLITANVHGNDIMHNDERDSSELEERKPDKTNLSIEHDAELAEKNAGTFAVPANPAATPQTAPGMNPAAEAAPALNNATPEPATVVNGTNDVKPEDVVVQPIIPNAAGNNVPNNPVNNALGVNPAVTNAPVDQMQIPTAQTPVINPAPASDTLAIPTPAPVTSPEPTPTPTPTPQPMNVPAPQPSEPARTIMAEPPAAPTTRQFGNAIQPPAPTKKAEKNYAEMMAAALAEPAEMPASPGATPEPATTPEATAIPNAVPATPEPATPPVMEPVANPNANILPPPPAPNAGPDMMPPVLPPVSI